MDERPPITLCHPACSGGSLIFRLLCAQFNLVGVSEKSHCFQYVDNVFLPTDPEYSLLVADVIDLEEFGKIFLDRVLNTISICQSRHQRVLIREHTHSYFFQGISSRFELDHPSWIADRIFRKTNNLPKCIVTVRDPIDSWLGLERNMPDLAPKDFDQYCAYYLEFIKSAEKQLSQGAALLVRYENFVEDPAVELRRISEFLNEPFTKSLSQNWRQVKSSGNSGRQSDAIQRRRRRLYDLKLIKDARNSAAYNELIEYFDYPSLETTTGWIRRMIAPFVQAERYLATTLVLVKAAARKWTFGKSYVRPR